MDPSFAEAARSVLDSAQQGIDDTVKALKELDGLAANIEAIKNHRCTDGALKAKITNFPVPPLGKAFSGLLQSGIDTSRLARDRLNSLEARRTVIFNDVKYLFNPIQEINSNSEKVQLPEELQRKIFSAIEAVGKLQSSLQSAYEERNSADTATQQHVSTLAETKRSTDQQYRLLDAALSNLNDSLAFLVNNKDSFTPQARPSMSTAIDLIQLLINYAENYSSGTSHTSTPWIEKIASSIREELKKLQRILIPNPFDEEGGESYEQ